MGHIFRLSLFGESHGPFVGIVMDGVPLGLRLSEADFAHDLARRAARGKTGTTKRNEPDEPKIISGLYRGRTSGAPLTILFENTDTRPSDYSPYEDMPRPGHADFTARVKYGGFADMRGGGHFSGRLGVCLAAAGVVAKKIIPDVRFTTGVLRSDAEIESAACSGDSIGAVVEIRALGMKAGRGEPFFASVESLAAAALFSVPGVRGVEFGDGFKAADMLGSEHNDPIVDALGRTAKNGAGGINGGIANGNELVVRVACKPASSIQKPQSTWNFKHGRMETMSAAGRHDACIALRGAVVLEAALAAVLADLELMYAAGSCIHESI